MAEKLSTQIEFLVALQDLDIMQREIEEVKALGFEVNAEGAATLLIVAPPSQDSTVLPPTPYSPSATCAVEIACTSHAPRTDREIPSCAQKRCGGSM